MQAICPTRCVYALALSVIFCCSCHSSTKKGGEGRISAGVSAVEGAKYLGTYNGSFGDGLIVVVLNYISGDVASGYNIHRGLRRNINGEVAKEGGKLSFVLKEPGDNPYDGTFNFSLDTADLKINGKWEPLDGSKVSAKQLTLVRIPGAGEMAQDIVSRWSSKVQMAALVFFPNGTCEWKAVPILIDSLSQDVTVRGNYEQKGDTFRIEWEKNKVMPAASMKMTVIHTPGHGRKGESEITSIKGDGLELFKY